MAKQPSSKKTVSSLAVTPADSATTTALIAMPVGTVVSFGGAYPPEGWLLCDGSPVDGNKYPALLNVIGSKLPDLRGRFVVGAGAAAGLTNYAVNANGGAEFVALSVDQIPSHQHFGFGEHWNNWPLGVSGDQANLRGSAGGVDNDNYYYGTTSTGGGQAHENRPPYWALTYIIKY